MMADFSLAHLTVISLAPPLMVDVAASTGYRYVGFRLIPVTPDSPGYPLMNDKTMMRETKARLADTGIGVHDIEFVRFALETDVESFLPFLEAGAELGARHVVTAAYDHDRGRLIDRFGALCDLAAPFGLTIDLEFFPWADVPTLRPRSLPRPIARTAASSSTRCTSTGPPARSSNWTQCRHHGYPLCICATLRRRNPPRWRL